MYSLDLRHVKDKQIAPLGEQFCATAPDGREIGFTNYYMTMNGKPFFAVSGEMHFSRVSPDQWEDALVKLRCAGVNIVSTYVFWIVHEEEEGVFRFDGQRDVASFLSLCEKHGLMVILRVGPFAHGEMRNGGLPDWLYGKPYDVREDNPGFLDAAKRYFSRLHKEIDGHYFSQGGCIIAAQVDNEYQHSCAPWEMTTGVSNEWLSPGHSGEAYMRAVRRAMRESGIVTPFYTCTSWGGAVTPVDEMLPLWGGYSYQPWIYINYHGEHPQTPEYIYRDNHNNDVPSTYNFEPTYPPESRPYACCEMMGGMMCSYNYRFIMDMRAIDALANTKLGSGCNFPGYYMLRGGTTPTGACTPFLNEGQIAKRSYDYQAAIGEFGQIRESYGRLRTLHMFCHAFSGFFEETKTVLPAHLADLAPEDHEPLRFCVRVKGDRGFLFVNNFQDHAAMPARKNKEITLQLPSGDITFRFDIASGENAILPFNMPLGSATLICATAQPLRQVGDTWYFFAPEGMTPVYRVLEYGLVQNITPKGDEPICVGGMVIVTLTREEASGFYVYPVSGVDTAFLCDDPLLYDDGRLYVQTEDGCAVVKELSAHERAHWVYPIGWPAEKQEVEFECVGVGRYAIDLKDYMPFDGKPTLLRMTYEGDIGHAFVGGQMISDNFANGGVWDVRIDDHAKALESEPLTVYITPIKEGVVVDASSPMAGRIERAQGLTAKLISAEIINVTEIDLPLE